MFVPTTVPVCFTPVTQSCITARLLHKFVLRYQPWWTTEALDRLLLRAESVASSKIEGLEVGGRRLMRAAAVCEVGEEPTDSTAADALGNIAGLS